MEIIVQFRATAQYDPTGVANAVLDEITSLGSIDVDESTYTIQDGNVGTTDLPEPPPTEIEFDLVIQVERDSGKFISKAEIEEQIVENAPEEVEIEGVTYQVEVL